MPYQGSSNLTFQEEEELSPVKEQVCIYKDGKKKMNNFHEQKFPDLDVFQVNTSAKLKNVEAQIEHLVQAFKEKFSRTSPSVDPLFSRASPLDGETRFLCVGKPF